MADNALPKTLIEAVRYFSDPARCNEVMADLKWPNGEIVCPKCEGKSVTPVKGRPQLQCNVRTCKKQFSYKIDTIFEDSPLGLDKWFVAVWSIANCKNGVSSHELGRAIGVTQKTAWFMLHRIRVAMETDDFRKMNGEVESDETFVGGKAKNMHAGRRKKLIDGRGAVNKTAVQGILEREGNVRTFVVPAADAENLAGNIIRNVEADSFVYTDAATAYGSLHNRYRHSAVDHAIEFVRGRCHTNSVENFWSLLKRALKGTYVAVMPFHLHRYCHEQAWRFNQRKVNDCYRFFKLLKGVVGKRLTYRKLAGIDDAGFMGIQ
jgi:transposase-like protein